MLVNSTLVWSPGRTAIPRMRSGNPTRPLSIDQRAEDGGASRLSNDIDRRITRLDVIVQVWQNRSHSSTPRCLGKTAEHLNWGTMSRYSASFLKGNRAEAGDTLRRAAPVTSILFESSSRGQARWINPGARERRTSNQSATSSTCSQRDKVGLVGLKCM